MLCKLLIATCLMPKQKNTMLALYIYASKAGMLVQQTNAALHKMESFWGNLSLNNVASCKVVPTQHIGEEIRSGKMPDATCTNCVSTFNLGTDNINIDDVNIQFPCISLDKHKFSAAIVKFVNLSATVLLFRSGNAVCTGPQGTLESLKAAHVTVCLLRKGGFPVIVENFKVQNMVFVSQVDHGIDLGKLAKKYGLYVNYEPQLFPGLVFRIGDIHVHPLKSKEYKTKVVLNMFCSGKIVITGCRCVEEGMQAYRWALEHILSNEYKIFKDIKSSEYHNINNIATSSQKVESYIQNISRSCESKKIEFMNFPNNKSVSSFAPSSHYAMQMQGCFWLRAWQSIRQEITKRKRTKKTLRKSRKKR